MGSGPPMTLLHGFPSSSYDWVKVAPALAENRSLLMPDLLGFGDSDKPNGVDLSMTAQARYVRELLEHLGVGELAAIGHDLGGVVAQLLALDAGAKALVLIDAAAFDVWPIEGVRMLQRTAPEQETEAFVREVVALTLDLGVVKKERLAPELANAYTAPFLADPPAFFRAVRAIDGKGLAGRDDQLSALDVPAFLIWGEEDPFLPPEIGERLNAIMPRSTLALLPGCSHFVTEEAPETIVPLVYEYLRAQYLQEPHGHAHEPPLIQLRPPAR
jgi:pimeloyl-ACP methyl ester carboxylesterase